MNRPLSARMKSTGLRKITLPSAWISSVTKSITIPLEFQGSAVDPFGNNRIGFEGAVVINRKDWGVNWNAALEAGGVLVSEKVTLEFDVSAIRTGD